MLGSDVQEEAAAVGASISRVFMYVDIMFVGASYAGKGCPRGGCSSRRIYITCVHVRWHNVCGCKLCWEGMSRRRLQQSLHLHHDYLSPWHYVCTCSVAGNVLSKRRLQQLVHGNYVEGWDDPRLLTLRESAYVCMYVFMYVCIPCGGGWDDSRLLTLRMCAYVYACVYV